MAFDYTNHSDWRDFLKIIIAGGTGLVGSNIARALIELGHEVSILVRSGIRSRLPEGAGVIAADPGNRMDGIRADADLLVNAIGIIREYPSKGITFEKILFDIAKNLIDFALANKIRRFVQVSALGTAPDGKTRYFTAKYRAEEYLRHSSLAWMILRPSIIIGPGDQVTPLFSRLVKFLPLVPVVGDGEYKLQPMHVLDLAAGLAKIIEIESSYERIFEIGGPEIMSFNRLLDEIGEALGKRKVRKIYQPVHLIRAAARVFGRFSWFPITTDQITMLLDDSFTRQTEFWDLCGIIPRKFRDGISQLLGN